MKQRILTLLVSLSTIVGIKAQTQNDALYIYRNDGTFNAFLREEITEISISTIDTLGNDCGYDNYVVQEFHTQDTVYRIPISAIDSVSFVQPETKYRSDVVVIDEDMLWFVEYDPQNENKVHFFRGVPEGTTIDIGTIIISVVGDGFHWPNGLAGRVTNIESDGGYGYIFTCDGEVALEDIYERLVFAGKATGQDYSTRAASGSGSGSYTIPTIETSFGPINCSISPKIDVNFAICIGIFETPVIDILVQQKYDASFSIGTGDFAKISYDQAWWMNEPYKFYIPQVPGLGIFVKPGWWLKAEAGIEGNLSADISVSRVTHLKVDEHIKSLENYTVRSSVKPKFTYGFTAELSSGPCFEVGVMYLSPKLVNVDVAAFPGIYAKMDGQLTFDQGDKDTDQIATFGYRYLKDTKLEGGALVGFTSGCTVATKKLNFVHPMELYPEDRVPDFGLTARVPIFEWYNFPEFKRPTVKQDKESGFVLASTKPSRDLIFPRELGMVLYDEEDKSFIWDSYLNFSPYYEKEEWNNNNYMEGFLRKAQIGKTYTVYPTVVNGDLKLLAEPISEPITIKGEVTTGATTNVQERTATINGSAQDIIFEDARYVASGFLISKDPAVDINNNSTINYDNLNTQGLHDFAVEVSSGLTPNTKYYYRAYIKLNGLDPIYGEILSFTTGAEQEQSTVGKAIDLGLPSGTKWADHNLGTDKETGTGQFFAWGETSTKSSFTSQNSKWYGISTAQLEKQGVIDEEAILTPDFDAATRMWGSGWMMPSLEDYKELFSNCELKLGTMNNVWGMQAKGNNGNTIFFPGVGIMNGTSREYDGNTGIYWTADTDYDESNTAYAMYIDNTGDLDVIRPNRYYGLPIRPIYVENNPSTDYEYVDLGLSVLWATCNIGAKTPLDYGNYYAPAETKTKSEYTKENWFLSPECYEAYCEANGITYGEFQEMVAHLGNDHWMLNSSFDAATVNWGDPWRLPTLEEFKELVEKCKWEKYPDNGEWSTDTQAYKVTGPNGKSILLPIAGQFSNKVELDAGKTQSQAFYLSSTCYAGVSSVYCLWLYPWIDTIDPDTPMSVYGYSARPVMPK